MLANGLCYLQASVFLNRTTTLFDSMSSVLLL